MKRIMIWLVLLVMLVPAPAFAQIVLCADTVAQYGILDFTMEGEKAPLYRYTVCRDEEKLFQHETAYDFGSYVPRVPGEYTLAAEKVYDGEKTERFEAAFTVVDQLTCDLLIRSW